ncbi:aminoglycoside phosphotransferase family protein [Proteiniclasticum sp.]|jgi:Ser/Thr protein kinase RdoA (MazF antagonist)|uniref:phosphotransferase enzyme family protein n=1 Tax=Proteiniclasticum sp. TaxID=2053595 RepID=UPI002897F02B|nr:aminoglycoside phosphotransferase family protein [Proteiniclasticum sp.]
MREELEKIFLPFSEGGKIIEIIRYGKGHINDTYRVSVHMDKDQEKRYILQRINRSIFKDPVALMDNIVKVTEYLKECVEKAGGDVDKEVLQVVHTKEGAHHVLHEGEFYRCYRFIEGARSYEIVGGPEDFYKSGQALGKFQRLLGEFEGQTLHETIKDFHNTEKRFVDFQKAVEDNTANRAIECADEIQFYLEREKDTKIINGLLREGRLPVRVTHNDTKYNNVMIDDETREAVCLVDLDTVMPGVSLYDFGDAIRSGATTALEDEKDLSKVHFDLSLFEAYVRGYFSQGEFLTDLEIEYLPFAAKIMTYECGMRFLKDYLEGDIYYKISYPEHNLHRARNQMKLVSDMEREYQQMIEIIRKYRK